MGWEVIAPGRGGMPERGREAAHSKRDSVGWFDEALLQSRLPPILPSIRTLMRQTIATFFLLLYLYNFAGYLAVFSILQYRTQNEIRRRIASEISDDQLTPLAFHVDLLKHESALFQWVEKNEFRHGGEMYDVVRTRIVGDSAYFLCIRDTDEERLLSNLHEHTQREMNHSGALNSFDSFRDVFKNSFNNPATGAGVLVDLGYNVVVDVALPSFLIADAPFHPPKSIGS